MGRTLCIPTIFISYTGEALDYKMPLLRAIKAVDEAATAVCQYFDKDVTKVTCTLGLGAGVFPHRRGLVLRPSGYHDDRAGALRPQPCQGTAVGGPLLRQHPERAQAFMRDFETES
jgi:glutamine synthetase